MIDLELNDINHLKQSKYGLMYDPQYLLSHKDGGDGIFARGEIRLRELVESGNDIHARIYNESFYWRLNWIRFCLINIGKTLY